MRGASSKETVAWVCDQLHAVMGCSDRTTARFIVALAEKARDVGDLESGLGDAAIELTPATRRFAASLYARSRGGGARAARAAPRARAVAAESEAALRDRALAYDLVVGVEDDADAAALRKLQRKQKKKKEKEERKRAAKARAAGDGAGDGAAPRKRQRGRNRRETVAAAILDDDDDDAPTELVRRTPGTAAAAAAAAEPTAEELAAQARDADQLAKEEFEARLRARDEEKTRTLAGISAAADSKALDASAEAMTPAEREALVAKLRKESRYAYLTKREEKELKLLEWQIKDEEYLYEGQMHKLSSEERRQHEMNKVLLEAARARQKDGAELDSFARYQMPTAYDDGAAGTGEKNDKFTALTRRFEADEGPQLTEQERWEEQQTATATFRAGAKDKLAALDSAGASRGYEYVFEDQIDFISSELNAGKVVQKVRADGVVVEEEGEVVVAGDKPQSEKTIAEVRVSLPIYDYRQQLLDAIADNQVLIVVGETGSGKTTQIPQYLHEAGYTTPASENGEQSAVRVGCTQPRRVAAMSVASRVAQEMEVKLGAEVGYAIRFEDCTSEKTVVKYMTDGMLLRELLNEPDLASYSALMIDEAHERTLHTDILFGLIKDISRFRTDIKLVISSATMDAKRFAEYFDDAPIFNIPGRMYVVVCTLFFLLSFFLSFFLSSSALSRSTASPRPARSPLLSMSMSLLCSEMQCARASFLLPPRARSHRATYWPSPSPERPLARPTRPTRPTDLPTPRRYHVELLYTKAPEADYIDAAIVTVLQAHISQPLPGDILVFLTGQQEIETAEQILRMRTQGLGTKIAELIICPCYSTLPAEKQALIFVPTPKGARKVVLATNIAETSLTIDGVTFVIDPGFAKQKSYNPRTGMESLIVTPCSQAAANQRSGRAGRTAPGKCFRLFTQWSFQHELPENTIPEIQRTNMGSVVLMLKSMGINDLIHFDFMDPPPAETLIRALELLYALGAFASLRG
jgi:hypothetical protein